MTRPEFTRPSSREIQRSNGPGPSTFAYRLVSIKPCPVSKSFSMDSHIAGGGGNSLAGSVTCPRCGAANSPGTMFCANGGSALTAGAAGVAPPAAPMYPGAMPGLPSAWDAERRKQIDRTKTGVLLLLIGTLLGWLPLIGVVGALLVLVGAILVILGRKAFGPAHARKVMISILLFFIGIIIAIVAGIILTSALLSGFFGGAPSQAAVQSALNNYLIVAFVATIVGGLASVFFTYELQNQTGRYLLFAGYAATVIIQIAVFVIVSQTIATAIAAMFPGGTYNPVQAATAMASFTSQAQTIALLSGIPALLYAGANYIAWTRINKGEIPASTAPPPMAPAPMPPR